MTKRVVRQLIHARKIATVTATSNAFGVSTDGQTAAIMPAPPARDPLV